MCLDDYSFQHSDAVMYNDNSVTQINVGDTVIHTIFGEGIVVSIKSGVATIAFKYGIGIKTIAINHKYLSKK